MGGGGGTNQLGRKTKGDNSYKVMVFLMDSRWSKEQEMRNMEVTM